jgi:hypothetical protein
MTVAATVRKVGPTPGNSLATVFPFAFKVFLATDLKVELTVLATGVVSTLVLNDPLGYTVALNADQNANPGGSVTYNPLGVPLPATQALTISSVVPEAQGTHIINGGAFFANNVEDAIDKAVINVQDLAQKVGAAIQFPSADSAALNAVLPAAAQRANTYAAFDGAGNVIASPGPTSQPVSAAMLPVVQAATLALGRLALGISAAMDAVVTAATLILARAAMGLGLANKGGLLVGTGAGAIAEQAVGTDGYALQAQSGNASGVGYLPVAPFTLEGGYLDWTVAGNVLTVAIKTWAGADPSAADPVYVVFRDVTPAIGSLVKRKVTAANSVSLNNTALIGTVNAVAFKLWCVAFDDAATVRLGLVNCLSTVAGAGAGRDVTAIFPLAGWGIASSTLSDNAADNAQTFYTGVAVAAKAYATLGYATWETGLAAAGVWSAAPTRKHLQRLGDPLPNNVIQVQRTATGAVATGTTLIPDDDTIPQITEGDQYMSQAITPSSAANALEVRAQALLSTSQAGNCGMVLALFQDATANALMATRFNSPTADHINMLPISATILAAGTAATTLRARGGPGAVGTTTFNGSGGGGRKYGGVANSFIELREVMA